MGAKVAGVVVVGAGVVVVNLVVRLGVVVGATVDVVLIVVATVVVAVECFAWEVGGTFT